MRNYYGLNNGFYFARHVNNTVTGIWDGTTGDSLGDGNWVWIRLQHTMGASEGTARFRAWSGALESEPGTWDAEVTSTWFGPHGGLYGPATQGGAGFFVMGDSAMAGSEPAWGALTMGLNGLPAPPPPPPPTTPPVLSCAQVQRGAPATCAVTGAVDSVRSWSFTGNVQGPGQMRVDTLLNDAVWGGRAVISGMVEAVVRVGGDTILLADSLVVTPRQWGWGDALWSFTQGGGMMCGSGITKRFVTADAITLGLNTRTANCDGGSVDPSVYSPGGVTAGLSMDSVLSGPNRGVFFVDTVYYVMNRGSSMNPEVTSAGVLYPVSGQDRALCRRKLNLSGQDPVNVNMYIYNDTCRELSMAPFLQGIWDHEGFGTNSQTDSMLANGHESRGRIAAARPANDPYKLEGAATVSRALLQATVGNTIQSVDNSINAVSGDHAFVKDNWCGSQWVWNVATNAYVLIPIIAYGGCL